MKLNCLAASFVLVFAAWQPRPAGLPAAKPAGFVAFAAGNAVQDYADARDLLAS